MSLTIFQRSNQWTSFYESHDFYAIGGHPIILLKVLQSVIMTVTCTNL